MYKRDYMRVLSSPEYAMDAVSHVMTLLVIVERYRRVATTAVNAILADRTTASVEFIDDYRVLIEEENEVERDYKTEVQSA